VRNVPEKELPLGHNEDKEGNSARYAYFPVMFCVLKVGNTNSSISLAVIACSMAGIQMCFKGMYYLHLQGQRVKQATNKKKEPMLLTELEEACLSAERENFSWNIWHHIQQTVIVLVSVCSQIL
jgi:hypothetical protein